MAKEQRRRRKHPVNRRGYFESLEARTLLAATDVAINLLAPASNSVSQWVDFVAAISTSTPVSSDGWPISLYRDGSPFLSATVFNNQASFHLQLAPGSHTYSARIPLNDMRSTPGNTGFLPLTGNYYESVSNKSLTWSQANLAARSRLYNGRRGRIATVASPEEDNFIYSLMGSNTGDHWIGGMQSSDGAEPAANWQWITGEPFSYSHWRAGKPDNAYGVSPNEYRTSKYSGDSGSWLDIPDSFAGLSGGYIVEYTSDELLTGGISNFASVSGLTLSTTTTTSGVDVLSMSFGEVRALGVLVHDSFGAPVASGWVDMFYSTPDGQAVKSSSLFGGGATFFIQPKAPGTFKYTLRFRADPGYLSSSALVTVNVAKATSVMHAAISGSQLSISFDSPGDSEYASYPTGPLVLTSNGAALGTLALSGASTAAFDLAALPAGAYNLTLAYAGSDKFLPSALGPLAATVLPAPILTSSASSVSYGTPYTLTATLPASTRGEISIQRGAEVARLPLVGGVASLTLLPSNPLYTIGDTTYTAEFIPAEASDAIPRKSSLTVTVVKNKPTLTLVPSPQNPADGSISILVMLDFSQAPAPPNASQAGTIVLFRDGIGVTSLYYSGLSPSGGANFPSFTLKPGGGSSLTGAYTAHFHATAAYAAVISPTVNVTDTFGPPPLLSLSVPQSIRAGGTVQAVVTFDRPFNGTLLVSTSPAGPSGTFHVSGSSFTFPVSFASIGNYVLTVKATPALAPWNASLPCAVTIAVIHPTVIDLLALYSTTALQDSSYLIKIRTAVINANLAFSNSAIPVTIRLVGISPIKYNDSGSLATDLRRLYTLDDGYMDNVTALRNRAGADLTALFVYQASASQGALTFGIATELFNPASANRAEDSYIVVANSAFSNFVLAHEIGHTLGATHAVSDPTDEGATPYAHGYRFTGKDGVRYRDIMAYDPGSEIPYFSNPDISYGGVPIGNAATANASRVLRENAPLVAAYRRSNPFGGIDDFSYKFISGWALDPKLLFAASQVRIDIDGKAVATFLANGGRPDLTYTFGDDNHGFTYNLPTVGGGPHTITVYALDAESGDATLIGSRTFVGPPALFDDKFYLAKYADIAGAVQKGMITAWDHFNSVGQFELRSPSAYFDAAFYLAKNPDLNAAYANKQIPSPWSHYLASGQFENRQASPFFDPRFYRLANPDLAAALSSGSLKSLVNHFLTAGLAEGRNPIPFFDTASYKTTLADAGTITPLPYTHFLTSGNPAALAPSTWFNPATYLQLNPDLAPALTSLKMSAFDHFLRYGFKEGRRFSTAYSEKTYLAKNPDVANAVKSGLFQSGFEHFLLFGQKENRKAT